MDECNLASRPLDNIHATGNGVVVYQFRANTCIVVVGWLLTETGLRQIILTHVNRPGNFKQRFDGDARPVTNRHGGTEFQLVQAVIVDVSLVAAGTSQNRFPVYPCAEVDECRKVLELRIGIAVSEVYGRHDASKEAVVLHHIVHLCFNEDAQSNRKSTRLNSSHVKISYAV